MSELIKAYPGVPPFTWLIAARVTDDKFGENDACIAVFGKKGAGKSTLSCALGEGIAHDIAYLRGQGEDPTKFFNINHIVSVTREGAIRLLTSGILKQENSVILLDDVSLQWNSRRAMSWINTALNDILTIARVFRCVVIMNCIQASHLDKVARELTDFSIQMIGKNVLTKQSVFKTFVVEIGPDGTIYKKYLTWHGLRVKYWVSGKPSEELEKLYKEMRVQNTVAHLEESYTKMKEKLGEGEDNGPKIDKRIKDYTTLPEFIKHRNVIAEMTASGARIEAIVQKTGLTRYRVQRCQSALMNEVV